MTPPTWRHVVSFRDALNGIPVVRQTTERECAVACMRMVLAYHGRETPLDVLRARMVDHRVGTSGRRICEVAREHELTARAMQASVADLRSLPRASILYWQGAHFVVFDRATRRGLRIIDPDHGRRLVTYDALVTQFAGVAFVFGETRPRVARRSTSRRSATFALIWRLVDRRAATGAVMATTLVRLLGLGTALLTMLVVDYSVPTETSRALLPAALGATVLLLSTLLASIVRGDATVDLRTRLHGDLTMAVAAHVMWLRYSTLITRSGGELMGRCADLITVREMLTTTLVTALLDGVVCVCYFGAALVLHWPSAVLLLGAAVIQIAAVLGTEQARRELTIAGIKALDEVRQCQLETFSNSETIKGMALETRVWERWRHGVHSELDTFATRGRLESVTEAILATVQVASPLCVLLFGATSVMDGSMSLGMLVGLTAIATAFTTTFGFCAGALMRVHQAEGFAARLDGLLDEPCERMEGGATGAVRGAIRLEGVSFAYGAGQRPVIRDVTLSIDPGECVAIVGKTASGKSTLGRLIVGLLEPTEGTVSVDDRPLEAWNLSELRSHIGIVTQQPELFHGTVRDNIAARDIAAELDAVMAAAQDAVVHADVDALPNGYDTVLRDRGSSLSGGQRQRIALARALFGNPSILLLDEATSALDSITERGVHDAMMRRRVTRIMIAQRLSSIAGADRIIVLDDGRVVEVGTHESLLARQGAYWRLVISQRANSSVGASDDLSPVALAGTPSDAHLQPS